MADVKWIKIVTDIFDDDKFKLIDSMPEADAIELMWFKLLVFAGKSNNNGIFFFNDRVAYTDEMLSSVFNRPIQTVRLAMRTFMEFGMIEEIDGVYTIPNWEKHQSITDVYEKKKEYDKEYQRKRREKQKLLIEDKKSYENRTTVVRDCSYSISNSNSNSSSLSKDNNKEIISNIINYLNNKLGTNYRANTKGTVKHINARLNEGYLEEDFYLVIDKKYESWGNDPKMSQYLTPDTLFGTKFEKYYNEKPVVKKTQVDEWAEILNGKVE